MFLRIFAWKLDIVKSLVSVSCSFDLILNPFYIDFGICFYSIDLIVGNKEYIYNFPVFR